MERERHATEKVRDRETRTHELETPIDTAASMFSVEDARLSLRKREKKSWENPGYKVTTKTKNPREAHKGPRETGGKQMKTERSTTRMTFRELQPCRQPECHAEGKGLGWFCWFFGRVCRFLLCSYGPSISGHAPGLYLRSLMYEPR